MSCPHSLLDASLDRWVESHWHIHQIEGNYHEPDALRYSLNSFIRSAKEIPQILQMELQNHPDYRSVIKPHIERLKLDPLFTLLSKTRDFIVHRGRLDILSQGVIGTTEGRGWKISLSFPVASHESSDQAYHQFQQVCRAEPFVRSAWGPDCDSWPMLRREWRIPEFPDNDILDIAVSAWRTSGQVLSDIVVHFGGESLDLELACRHEPEKVRTRQYSRTGFETAVDGIVTSPD